MKKNFKYYSMMIIASFILFIAEQVNAQMSVSEVKSIMRDRGGWTASSDSRYAYLIEGQSTT